MGDAASSPALGSSCIFEKDVAEILGVSSSPPLPISFTTDVCEPRFSACCLYASATAPAGVKGELEAEALLPTSPSADPGRASSVGSIVRCVTCLGERGGSGRLSNGAVDVVGDTGIGAGRGPLGRLERGLLSRGDDDIELCRESVGEKLSIDEVDWNDKVAERVRVSGVRGPVGRRERVCREDDDELCRVSGCGEPSTGEKVDG